MKRHPFWPKARPQQVLWLRQFADKLEDHGAAVGLAAPAVTAGALDARRLAHVLGEFNTAVREFGPAVTAFQTQQMTGAPGAVLALPAFVAPPVPADAGPVAAGALTRIFSLVQVMKGLAGYTEAIGLELGVVGEEDAAEETMPEFTLKVEDAAGCQCVRISFKKFHATGVYIETRRGAGAWEFLTIDTESPYLDHRPLLSATAPEVREYRMRFFLNDTPAGDWTDVARATVAPA